MNSSKFVRFVDKTSRFFTATNGIQRSRVINPLRCNTMATNVSISESKERDAFQEALPCVIDTVSSSQAFRELPEVASWVKKVLEYNLAGGKKMRGLTTVFAYEILEKPENITEDNLRLARIMGWCVEMLQAYYLVADDMMDGSTTRRGVPCWYRLPDVGLGAINDSIFIFASIYEVLRAHFKKFPQYADILDIFNESVLFTSSGQHLDYTMAHRNKNDYSLFTVERYESIVKYKTAYYTFRLPVSLGLLLANITDKTTRERADEICLEIGKYYQIQDDFIDCFSDESVTGKAGTDIQEGKCCWLAVTALQLCNSEQRAMFEECYASKDSAHVRKIKQLYEELNLPQIYKEHERAWYDNIVNKIKALNRDTSLSPELFYKLIDIIYNRKK